MILLTDLTHHFEILLQHTKYYSVCAVVMNIKTPLVGCQL